MGRIASAPKTKYRRKNRPDSIKTKEDLIFYLNSHEDSELPFVEDCWNAAVIKATENSKKEVSTKNIITKTANGDVIKEEKTIKLITDPVKQYFKMCGLNVYKKKAMEIKTQKRLTEHLDEHEQEIVETYFSDNSEKLNDEIAQWIGSIVNPSEREYVKGRYINYMNNYEINDGADKSSLKGVLSLELALYRIDADRAAGKSSVVAEEEKLRKALRETFEALKWNKKQRNIREELAQNKFTVWLDNMVKEGEFVPNPKHYEPDEVDFIIETSIEAQRKMLE